MLRQERALGELISDSFSIYFAHWRDLCLVVVPAVIVNLAFSLVHLALENNDVLASVSLLVSIPFNFIAFVLVGGGAVELIDKADSGQTLTSAEALDAAQARFGRLAGASLRATAIIGGLFITIVGIPWAIARAIRWVFITQSIMIDGETGASALAHSAALVQGRWWNTFGRLLVSGIVVGVPAGLVGQLALSALPGVPGTVLGACTGFLSIPYGIIATTLMFFDLKARKRDDDNPSPA
jgi:hypothetical protein